METREQEVWEDVPEFEGFYKISSWGNFKSCDRILKHSTGKPCQRKGILLKPYLTDNGYQTISFSRNGIYTRYYVHVLVAIVFLGYDQSTGETINHKNFNKVNNYYKNLEISSYRENLSHMALRRETSSEFIGVAYNNFHKKFQAYIRIDKKLKHLGYFTDELNARQAYLNALKEYGLENKYATQS